MFGQREHLKGVAIYDINGQQFQITAGLPANAQTGPAGARARPKEMRLTGEFRSWTAPRLGGEASPVPMHILRCHCIATAKAPVHLVLFHDASYIAETQVQRLPGRDALIPRRFKRCLIQLVGLC